jgi:hypothetical protein
VLTAAYAAMTRAAVAVLTTLVEQVTVLLGQIDAHFGQNLVVVAGEPAMAGTAPRRDANRSAGHCPGALQLVLLTW